MKNGTPSAAAMSHYQLACQSLSSDDMYLTPSGRMTEYQDTVGVIGSLLS
jgi:hypothetical protein